MADSRLGLTADEVSFTDGLRIVGTDTITVDREWEPVWGEYDKVRDHFRELAVRLASDDGKREITVRFRLFDDGLGFRYEMPVSKQNKNYLTLRDESTEFNFTGDHTLFCIPATMTPTNTSGRRHHSPDSRRLSAPISATARHSAPEATPSDSDADQDR